MVVKVVWLGDTHCSCMPLRPVVTTCHILLSLSCTLALELSLSLACSLLSFSIDLQVSSPSFGLSLSPCLSYSPVSRTRVKFKMQTVIDSNWTLSLLHFSMLCVHARARAFSLARSFPLLLANFTRSLSHPPSMFFSLPIPRLRGGSRCSFRKRILSNSTFTDRYLSWRLRHSGMICGV